MKNILFLILLWLFFGQPMAFATSSYPAIQAPKPGDSLNVFLHLNSNDETTIYAVRSAFKGMNGVEVIAFCDNHSLFLIKLSTTYFRDENDFMAEIKKDIPKYENLLSFKQGDFYGFFQYCEPGDNKDLKNIKKELDK